MMGGERQLAHARNCHDARAFGVRLSSETDSPLSHPSVLSKTKRIAIYWVSLNSCTLFELRPNPGECLSNSKDEFYLG